MLDPLPLVLERLQSEYLTVSYGPASEPVQSRRARIRPVHGPQGASVLQALEPAGEHPVGDPQLPSERGDRDALLPARVSLLDLLRTDLLNRHTRILASRVTRGRSRRSEWGGVRPRPRPRRRGQSDLTVSAPGGLPAGTRVVRRRARTGPRRASFRGKAAPTNGVVEPETALAALGSELVTPAAGARGRRGRRFDPEERGGDGDLSALPTCYPTHPTHPTHPTRQTYGGFVVSVDREPDTTDPTLTPSKRVCVSCRVTGRARLRRSRAWSLGARSCSARPSAWSRQARRRCPRPSGPRLSAGRRAPCAR